MWSRNAYREQVQIQNAGTDHAQQTNSEALKMNDFQLPQNTSQQ